jgi:hypothetical protein
MLDEFPGCSSPAIATFDQGQGHRMAAVVREEENLPDFKSQRLSPCE